MNRCLPILNRVVAAASVMTIILVAACAVGRKCGLVLLPEWSLTWGIPILTAGAVGYLTNYAAIWLLFRPYRPVRWLWGLQGVIPREQPALAERLGEEIPKNLLPPEELAAQLGLVVKSYLKNPELIADIRVKVGIFVKRYSTNIVAFIMPHIEYAIKFAAQTNFTPERMRMFYDALVGKWLGSATNRQWLAANIVAELQARMPELTSSGQELLEDMTRDYIREEYPTMSRWLSADKFAAKRIGRLNWSRIQNRLLDALSAPQVREIISSELVSLSGKIRQYLSSPNFGGDCRKLIDVETAEAESLISAYIEENLPAMVENYLRQEEFWRMVEQQLLPIAQSFIVHRLKYDKNTIIAGLNLEGRIENAIMQQNPQEVHALINRISGEHLVRLQLLGYGLGAVAGILLSLAR